MAYVPGYAADIFISYSHLDNRDGWVTELKSKLEGGLKDLSRDVEVWFDADRLETGDVFKPKIQDDLANTRILIAVISPNYLSSQFCMEKELAWFQDKFGSEIIQFVRSPLTAEQDKPLPEALFKSLHDGEGNPLTGKPLQDELSKEIWALRKKLEAARKGCTRVYLSGVKHEVAIPHREKLRGLLHQRERLAVLPSEVITPRTQQQRLLTLLGDSTLSVHYDLPGDPLHDLQIQAAKTAGRPILRIRHLDPATDAARTVSRKLLELRRNRHLYLIFDPFTDGNLADPIRKYFDGKDGVEILEPQPGESYHKARLEQSDGILFLHRDAPPDWRDKHIERLRQGAVMRENVAPEAWYFLSPANEAESEVQTEKDPSRPQWTIRRKGPLDLADLQPFFQSFLKPRAASA